MSISSSKKLGKKIFLVNGIIKKFTNRLLWFSSERIFTDVDPHTLPVACTKCCKMVLKAPFPKFKNLTHHLSLENHFVYQKWKLLQHVDKVLISDPVLALVKYLIGSYTSFSQLSNPHLLQILNDKIAQELTSVKVYSLL